MSDTSSFKLIIEDDEGRRSVVPIDIDSVREGISIGRQEGNTIRLNERNVSRRHARFVRDQAGIFAEDLDSYNGVWINGDRIKGRQELHDGDTIRVGDFQLELRGEGLQRRVEETTQRTLVSEGSEVTRPDIRLEEAMNGGPLSPTLPGLSGVGAPIAQSAATNGAAHAQAPSSRAAATIDEDVQPRPEPTALIRMDHVESLEAGRKRDAAGIAGQKGKLICVSTQFAGTEYEIEKTEVVIGRTEENDIAIDHRSVSRHHAKIVVNQRSYRIMDLKSANGTLVNGEEYAQTELKRGDLIELGHVKFRFLPPGASYDFNAEELAAVRQGATNIVANPQTRPTSLSNVNGRTEILNIDRELVGISAAPTAINQWSDELSIIHKKKLRPLIVAGISALVVVLIGGGAILALNHNNPQPSLDRDGNRVVKPADGSTTEQQDLRSRAKQALVQREWNEARKLAEALLVMNAADAEALEIKQRATDEILGQSALDRAVRAIEQRNWDDAWRNLAEVPESTSAHTQSVSLRAQVRAGRVIAKIEEAKRRVTACQLNEARQAVDEINDMDPLSPELTGLRQQISNAERTCTTHDAAAVAADASGRDKRATPAKQQTKTPQTTATTPANTGTTTPPPDKTKPANSTPAQTTPPATTAADSKTYYSLGLQALQAQDTEKAIEQLDKCVKADTKAGMCYRALGIAYARLKNGPKAAKYYRMYLRVMPDAKDAKQVEELLKAYEGAATP